MFLFNSGFPKSFTVSLSLLFLSLFIAHTAIAAPGDLDTSFGSGGIATARIGKISADFAYSTALQPDGKIIVAGANNSGIRTNFLVARINPDGTLDTSFGTNGAAVKRINDSTNYATSVIIQPDGKIVAGGFSLNLTTGTNNFTLVRFNANGSVDDSFGTSGVVQTTFPDSSRSWINALAIQSDGKIIAAGHTYGGNTTNALAFAVARYNADGSLDASFDGDGKRLLFFGNSIANRANSVVIQPDGKIVLGGYGMGSGSGTQFAIARLNPDGSYDTSFDGDGKLTTAVGTTGSVINALLLQTNGKITAVGSRNNSEVYDVAVASYNADGSLDTSFDTDGIATADIGNDTITGAVLQADGKIVAGGHASLDTNVVNQDFISVRFNTDGSLDTTFDGDGKVITQVTPTEDRAGGMLLQSDGRIVLTGYGVVANYDMSLVRYNTNGSLDSSFAGDGIAFIESGSSGDLASATAVQPDGKIVAAGHRFNGLYNEIAVTRFNQNGSHDITFGNGGIVSVAMGGAARTKDVIVQPDGKILVGGNGIASNYNAFIIIRLNPDGSFDSTFGDGGVLALSVGIGSDYFAGLALQPDGKIIAAGYCAGELGFEVCVAKLLANGTLDTSFGSDGRVVTIDSVNNDQITSVALQADGKIVVAGAGYGSTGIQRFLISRYNTDGTLDTNFAGGSGKTYTVFYPDVSLYSGGSVANAVKIQADGKIVAAGYTGIEGSYAGHYALARYNTDGTLDNTFDSDGKVTTIVRDLDVGYCQIYGLGIQQNGKIVVAGTAFTTDFVGSVFRYNTDGSLDTTFGSGGKALTPIGAGFNEFYGMTIQPDGKIIAAGYSSNGSDDDFTIARYQGDATTPTHPTVFDFDGDGKTDISIFRPSVGEWWYSRSSDGGNYAAQFGNSSDKLVPGDYTGDGRADIAVFRPSTGEWFILRSEDGSYYSFPFGTSGDIPAVGDFDADGKADQAVFRPSDTNWYIRRSSDGGFTITQFGASGDVPAVADYDGDGKSDIAIWRASVGEWWIKNSSNSSVVAFQFGNSNDKPVQGDYTGDGKADVAIWRPSTGEWFILRSEDYSYYSFPFGTNGDIPAPGDYDGDGRFDATVFRPSGSTWYVQRTTAGTLIQSFGQNGDVPVPNAFVP